jgi:RimJ/RimL family protein N-acetyltransferase
VAHDFSLETERLRLRPFAPGDFEALLAMQSRPDVARWLYGEARDADAVRAALEAKLGRAAISADGEGLSFAVVLERTGELIGDCSVFTVSGQHRQGEIGFIFHPDHHGHGYAAEAARALLAFAFGECRFHRVIGRLEARNSASARVLERIGMRQEAHFAEKRVGQGRMAERACLRDPRARVERADGDVTCTRRDLTAGRRASHFSRARSRRSGRGRR